MGQLVGGQGQVKVAKKMQKHPPENAKPKTKKFVFGCQLEDLLNP